MRNAITDVPGIRVGQAQDFEGATGCTVILCEADGAVAGVDVRGSAPGVRETDTIHPLNFITKANAVYLSGGSAFGLDGASGVMQFLEEKKIGIDVEVTHVPIVLGAVLFDLNVGSPNIRPDKAMGYKACQTSGMDVLQGNVGAGTGATIGKSAISEFQMKGGVGTASRQIGNIVIGAIVVVNCYGDIIDKSTGKIIAGCLNKTKTGFADTIQLIQTQILSKTNPDPFKICTNTTLGCIATNAKFTKSQCTKLAQMAHDGFARSINPVHTMFDGDIIFSLSTGDIEADLTSIGSIGAEVMSDAIVNAIKNAKSAYGYMGYLDLPKILL
ncbi:MAG: putative peptidase S58 family protein [Streblomastix strix]|uniref:Putative peptidase S58 family protein n=1 Tax=Streblomastix strix TaxID=222440 RepID=A0A5J4WEQ5_9EUKA|nr:MAG: putative peptidase S58 family protein [Streblomastix strix]